MLNELKELMEELEVMKIEDNLYQAVGTKPNGEKVYIPIIWPKNKTAKQIADETLISWRDYVKSLEHSR